MAAGTWFVRYEKEKMRRAALSRIRRRYAVPGRNALSRAAWKEQKALAGREKRSGPDLQGAT